jgi:ribosomal protein L37AE/L43A
MSSDPKDPGPATGAAPPVTRRSIDAPTTLICERCGNVNLIRVKGCWYCERCHYKFDCYGW